MKNQITAWIAHTMTFQHILFIILCFVSAALGTMMAWKANDAVNRSRRAYLNALKASNQARDKLIEALKEENDVQQRMIRQMANDRNGIIEVRPLYEGGETCLRVPDRERDADGRTKETIVKRLSYLCSTDMFQVRAHRSRPQPFSTGAAVFFLVAS